MTTLPRFIAPERGITTTIAWSIDGQPTYAFEGNILVSAAALPWMVEMLGLPDVQALTDLAATAEAWRAGLRAGLRRPRSAILAGRCAGTVFRHHLQHDARPDGPCGDGFDGLPGARCLQGDVGAVAGAARPPLCRWRAKQEHLPDAVRRRHTQACRLSNATRPRLPRLAPPIWLAFRWASGPISPPSQPCHAPAIRCCPVPSDAAERLLIWQDAIYRSTLPVPSTMSE